MFAKLRTSVASLMRRRYFVVSTCAALCAVGLFLFVSPLYAGFEVVGEFVGTVVHWICGQIILPLLVMLITLVLNFMISVVLPWQVFTTAPAVEAGWIICRDVANMFFAIILIVIAVGTILNIERYHYKTWLTRLVMMIVLVNFSKTICGIIIDFAQVVMLTFSAAVVESGVGNFMQAIGLLDLQRLADNGNLSVINVAINDVLAVVFATIALCVFVGMTVMLLFRVFMLWILIILSPFAYLGSTFERGKAMHGKWWEKFIENVVAGPVLALFIYLTLTTVSETNALVAAKLAGEQGLGAGVNVGVGLISNPQVFSGFMVGIGMLIAGMMITQEVGGASGAAFSFGYDKAMGAAKGAGRFAGGFALGRLRDVSRATGLTGLGARALKGVQKFAEKAGGYEGKGFLGRLGATALAATGLRGGLGEVGRRIKGFSHDQLEAAKHDLDGYSTNQLKIVTRQGGPRGQAAEEMLLSKEHLDELRKDDSNRGFVKNLVKHAKEHGFDTEKVEDKYLGFYDPEAKAKSLREASDARKLSEKDLEDSGFIHELENNAVALKKFKEGSFEKKSKVKVRLGNGSLVSVDLGAGSAYVDENDVAIKLNESNISEKNGKYELKDKNELKALDDREAKLGIAELMASGEYKGSGDQREALLKGIAKAHGKDLITKNILELAKDSGAIKGYDRLIGTNSSLQARQVEAIILKNKTPEDKRIRGVLLDSIAMKIASNLKKGPNDPETLDINGHFDVYAGMAPDVKTALTKSAVVKDTIEKEVKKIIQKGSIVPGSSVASELLSAIKKELSNVTGSKSSIGTAKGNIGFTPGMESRYTALVDALKNATRDADKDSAINTYNAAVLNANKAEMAIANNDKSLLKAASNVENEVRRIVEKNSQAVQAQAAKFENIAGLINQLKDAKQRPVVLNKIKKMQASELKLGDLNSPKFDFSKIEADIKSQVSEKQIKDMLNQKLEKLNETIDDQSDIAKLKKAIEGFNKASEAQEEYRHEAEKFIKKSDEGGGH